MKVLRYFTLLALVLLCLPGVGLAKDGKYLVFAAASLRDVLEAAGNVHEASCDCEIVFSFAGSSVLARQIDAGAPAALFISANQDWVSWLVERGRVEPHSVSPVAGNRLVIAVNQTVASTDGSLAILTSGKFAMGDPVGVPAGIYAKAALERLGLWKQVNSNAVFSENVRVSLSSVARGDLPAGIVYQSDLLVEPRVSAYYRFEADTHPPIQYVAAKPSAAGAGSFMEFLISPAGQNLFSKFGFTPLSTGTSQ